jgi:hypothetical protein
MGCDRGNLKIGYPSSKYGVDMAYVGLVVFLVGLRALILHYTGKTPPKRELEDEREKELESQLYYGIINSWGAVIIGLLCMLIFPWNCNGT